MTGTLYIVATPIGNLNDMTQRSIDILSDVELIVAEDTRVAKKLLNLLGIKREGKENQIMSYHAHSAEKRKLEVLRRLVGEVDVALITDAGTPGISDPGNELIDYLLVKEPNIKVVPIPGASALASALSICGFNVNKFVFLGFWPKKKSKKSIDLIKLTGLSAVFFDSPYRVLNNLSQLEKEFGGDRRVFVGRELTKMYEESFRGTLSEVKEQMEKANPKGEVVVVLEGDRGGRSEKR